MNLLQLFNKRKQTRKQRHENMAAVKADLAKKEEAVYSAVKRLNRPVTAQEVARFMGVDSAGVFPRLTKLGRKGRVNIPFKKKGLDGIWRAYYTAAKEKKF